MTTMLAARAAYYEHNAFGADGGFSEPWAEAEFGRVAYIVPNLEARARALQVHDFHHVLTEYDTDWRGESQISAWELGAGGGGRYAYAWFIALFGFAVGLAALPRATAQAFVRGRQSANLYGEAELERWHLRSVADSRDALGVLPRDAMLSASWLDRLWLLLFALAALPVILLAASASPLAIFLAHARHSLARVREVWQRSALRSCSPWVA